MKIVIKQLSYKERNAVFSLYRSVFGQDGFERWKRRWNWQFIETPGSESAPYRMWVGKKEDGKILGFFESFPIRLKIGTKENVINCPCDLMVDKEARGHGLGQRMIQAYIDGSEILINAFGYSPGAKRIYLRLGYEPVYFEPISIRPFDLNSIFQFLMDNGRVPTVLTKRPLRQLIQFLCTGLNKLIFISKSLRWPKISQGLVVEEVKQIDSEFDILWRSISHHFPIIVVRDQKFVKWRFLDDPVFEHTLLVARDLSGKLCGYLDFCVSKKKEMLFCRIMDIFCTPTSVDVIDSLLGRALELMEEKNVAVVSCMGLHPDIRKRVERFLYLKPKNLNNPALLYCKDKDIEKIVYDENNWHFTHADGDEGFAP